MIEDGQHRSTETIEIEVKEIASGPHAGRYRIVAMLPDGTKHLSSDTYATEQDAVDVIEDWSRRNKGQYERVMRLR